VLCNPENPHLSVLAKLSPRKEAKGSGKWFSGSAVFGDGVDLGDEDRRWIVREQLYFRIKMDTDPVTGQLISNSFLLDFPKVNLNIIT
jgi:hypothetical protein